jgi:hypothetical protein
MQQSMRLVSSVFAPLVGSEEQMWAYWVNGQVKGTMGP